jgi:hypothetical protein
MTTTIEYALMAGASYISTRTEINQFPVSSGWTQTKHANPQDGSGFEAVSFINGATLASSTEIVISYAGTYDKDFTGDKLANVGLAMGTGSTQLLQAIEYYLQVKAANPDVTITLIGHSLGGGLAALVGVFFGVQTQTFDQAPFRRSALTYATSDPETGVMTTRSVAQDLRAYLAGSVPADMMAKLDAYIVATDPTNANPVNSADTLAGREGFVKNINTQGEIVSLGSFIRIGNEASIPQGTVVSLLESIPFAINLHSQALLTTFLQSNQTASTSTGGQMQSLSEVTFKLTDLLKMVFDGNLFEYVHVQAGASEMDATDANNRNAFMLGDAANDARYVTQHERSAA